MKINRREFIGATAAGVTLAAVDLPAQQSASDIDALYDRAIVCDTQGGERWDAAGLAAWKKSGYTCIQTTLDSGQGPRGRFQGEMWSEGTFTSAMQSLEEWQQRIRKSPDVFIHCTKAADIERAKREGKLAVILGFQDAPFNADVENVKRLYDAGARLVQLTYMSRNLLGDGSQERTSAGLSRFGIACVERMNDLGMIVDLSHCGDGTTSDGIAFSSQPVAITHTVCQAVYARLSGGVYSLRAKTDDLLRALGNKGGFVSISTLGYFVSPKPDASIEDYIDHIAHAVKVCGIEHVGVSTDHSIRGQAAGGFTRENWQVPRLMKYHSLQPRWPPWIPALDTPDRFRAVAHALAKRGFKAADIEGILGGNWVRFVRDVFRG